MGFSKQEYWSWLPFPSPGGLPDSGIEPVSPALQTDSLPSEPPGNSWIFIRRTNAEAKTLNTLATWYKELTHWKRPWCWERLKAGEGDDREWDVGCHHWLNGHEFVQTPRGSEGQRSLACCSPWGLKEQDLTEWLNNKTVPFTCRNLTDTARKILFPWNNC